MKKNAKLAALAILVLAAVAALSVGITLAVVNARMPAACTCSGQCRSAGTETAAAGDAPSAQQTEPSEADSISIPGFDFLSLQAGAQEQSMPLYNPENNACYFRISLLLDGEALWRSDLLAPGQTAPQQTLSRALAAGCFGAIYWAHLDKIYYANDRKDAGKIGFDDDFIYKEIALEPQYRKKPSEILLRNEAINAFKMWTLKDDKNEY